MLPTMIMSDGVIKQIITHASNIQDQKSVEKYVGSWTGCSMYAVEIIRMCQKVQPGQDGWFAAANRAKEKPRELQRYVERP